MHIPGKYGQPRLNDPSTKTLAYLADMPIELLLYFKFVFLFLIRHTERNQFQIVTFSFPQADRNVMPGEITFNRFNNSFSDFVHFRQTANRQSILIERFQFSQMTEGFALRLFAFGDVTQNDGEEVLPSRLHL